MLTKVRLPIIVLSSLSLVAGAGAVTVVSSSADTADQLAATTVQAVTSQDGGTVPSQTATPGYSERQLANFAVLRKTHGGVAQDSALRQQHGGPATDVRAGVTGPTTGGLISIAPARDDGLCIGSSASLSCVSEADALAGRANVVESCTPGLKSGEFRVYGLLPDNARAASLLRDDGAVSALTVVDGLYSDLGDAAPQQLTWTSADGDKQVVDFPLPPGATADATVCASP